MSFNSPVFFVFLAIAFLVYWRMRRKEQNLFLLFCSYVFYGWWDWRFLSLIIVSSLTDYVVGHKIFRAQSPRRKRYWLLASVLINLSLLGFFKYFNFFIESFQGLLLALGFSDASFTTLSIILPVGISFYTFQTLSYSIELYQGKIRPTRDWVQFFTFVSFFPQLVAGPIERASHLLGQFSEERRFKLAEAYDGVRQILWGLFKKVVIADNLATVVQQAYGNVDTALGPQFFAATFFFAFQIYCDFSGYSDIAIGSAKLFGIKLSRNFNYPYFSRNISEFWRRWHITLSSWFRDYVFIPLGGSRVARKWTYFRNILITFAVSGLWHGANWTFVVWGVLHGLYFIPTILTSRIYGGKPANEDATLRDIPKILATFVLVTLGWVFFRAQSLPESVYILQTIFEQFSLATITIFFSAVFIKKTIIVVGLVLVEWWQRRRAHVLCLESLPVWVRWSVYYAILAGLFFFGNFDYRPFIYFQF